MPDGGLRHDLHRHHGVQAQPSNELLEAKQTLEQRVSERTHELSDRAPGRSAPPSVAAEQANATKTRFVAAASHDLLQPLNAARLFAVGVERCTCSMRTMPCCEIAGRIDRLVACRRGSARRHARHRAPRKRLHARRDHRVCPRRRRLRGPRTPVHPARAARRGPAAADSRRTRAAGCAAIAYWCVACCRTSSRTPCATRSEGGVAGGLPPARADAVELCRSGTRVPASPSSTSNA